MRYTETKYDTPMNGVADLLKFVVTGMLFAPLRFTRELSLKVLFLDKKSINRMLLVSIIIGFIVTCTELIKQALAGNVGLQNYEYSLLYKLTGLGILAVIWYFSETIAKKSFYTLELDNFKTEASHKILSREESVESKVLTEKEVDTTAALDELERLVANFGEQGVKYNGNTNTEALLTDMLVDVDKLHEDKVSIVENENELDDFITIDDLANYVEIDL